MPGKRIMAIAALVLIGVLYLATLVLSFIDSPLARSFLMAALFCTGICYLRSVSAARDIHQKIPMKKTFRGSHKAPPDPFIAFGTA